MRIGLVLPTVLASKKLYPELIFAPGDLLTDLSRGLVKKGHEVTVFSTPDFETSGRLVSSPLDYFLNKVERYKFRNLDKEKKHILGDNIIRRSYELDVLIKAFQSVKNNEFDILHIYHDSTIYLPHYLNKLINFPVVYTLHDPLPPPGSFEYLELTKFKDDYYISISEAMKKADLKLNFVATIYHGIDITKYSYSGEGFDDYLLFVGRIVPEKGPDDAIFVANKLNKRLFLAYDESDINKKFYQTKIKPLLTGDKIQAVGFLQPRSRNEYMKKARLVIFPVKWNEPFGMVLIESMACGTPVVAYAQGSVPEIIKDGETGFIVNLSDEDKRGEWIVKKTGIEGLCEAVERIYAMTKEEYQVMRCTCRAHVEANFTVEKMVVNYEKVYQKILAVHQ